MAARPSPRFRKADKQRDLRHLAPAGKDQRPASYPKGSANSVRKATIAAGPRRRASQVWRSQRRGNLAASRATKPPRSCRDDSRLAVEARAIHAIGPAPARPAPAPPWRARPSPGSSSGPVRPRAVQQPSATSFPIRRRHEATRSAGRRSRSRGQRARVRVGRRPRQSRTPRPSARRSGRRPVGRPGPASRAEPDVGRDDDPESRREPPALRTAEQVPRGPRSASGRQSRQGVEHGRRARALAESAATGTEAPSRTSSTSAP